MATSSVNPMNLLATPSTGSARSLAVPDGFAESLSKAIRREDAPVARRERPQSAESDQPATKPSEQSTAPAEADVERDATNTEAEASAEQATGSSSQEQEPQDDNSAGEMATDVVVISEQAKQQAIVVAEELIAEGEAVIEPTSEAAASWINGTPQKQDTATTMPPPEASAEGLPIAQVNETTEQAAADLAQKSSLVPQEASNEDLQSFTSGPQDTPVPAVKLHTHDDVPAGERLQEGEMGTTKPTDGSTVPQELVPVIPVQATEGEAGRKSSDDHRHSTSKVEPVAVHEAAPDAGEVELDILQLHTEGETTTPEAKDRPASHATNFPSVLERTNSLTSQRTTPTEAPSHQMPQVDAQRFINRVSRAFQVAENRGGPLQLRLSPPELGALKIELSIQQGTLTAKLETETAAAKTVLLDNLPALRERLAAQEIRIDKFEVDVRQQNSGEQPNWQAQQDGEDARHARAVATGRRTAPPETTEAPAATATTPSRTHHNGQFSAVA